jgi:hypothetical protein
VVQLQKYGTPAGARSTVRYYTKNGRKYATDGTKHWYLNDNGRWVKTAKSAVPLHNRFKPDVLGRGGDRAGKFTRRKGSGASYSDVRRRRQTLKVTPITPIGAARTGKRKYTQNMQALTGSASATAHALSVGAPPVPGGYNWCHLIGRGAGGRDDAQNVVAASTHANSEQLALESVLYNFKQSGVSARCSATAFQGQVARTLTFQVFVMGQLVYSRNLDGFRSSKPTITELKHTRDDLTKAITDALR